MANVVRKSGEFVYLDDGSTAQQVYSDNAPDTTGITPVDIQSRLSSLTQSHNAIVNPASAAGSWINCDGFDEVAFSSNIAGTLVLQWSNDGTAVISTEQATTATIIRGKVAMPWVRPVVTATGTVTTYTYLRS